MYSRLSLGTEIEFPNSIRTSLEKFAYNTVIFFSLSDWYSIGKLSNSPWDLYGNTKN
jgi:hypothetical protein